MYEFNGLMRIANVLLRKIFVCKCARLVGCWLRVHMRCKSMQLNSISGSPRCSVMFWTTRFVCILKMLFWLLTFDYWLFWLLTLLIIVSFDLNIDSFDCCLFQLPPDDDLEGEAAPQQGWGDDGRHRQCRAQDEPAGQQAQGGRDVVCTATHVHSEAMQGFWIAVVSLGFWD